MSNNFTSRRDSFKITAMGTAGVAICSPVMWLGCKPVVRIGLFINLFGVVLITMLVFTLGMAIFGIDLSILPAWAQ